MNTTSYTSDMDYEVWDFNFIFLMDEIFTWSLLPVGVLGLITNSLNVAVYSMIGFQDSVSVCFFALSACDLCFIIIRSSYNIYNVITLIVPSLLFYHGYYGYYIYIRVEMAAYYGDMIFDISACIKTFIAVQRGCCVAFPFHVNRVFTNRTAAAVILCLCLVNLASYVIDEFLKGNYTHGLIFDNQTHYYDFIGVETPVSGTVHRTFNRTVLICTGAILILLSFVIIVSGMISTPNSSVGKYSTQLTSKPWAKNLCSFAKKGKRVSKNVCNCHQNGQIPRKQRKLNNNRELRVIKQVVLISTLHLICYTPVAAFAVTYETTTDSTLPLDYFFGILNIILEFIGPLNAAINFFIYYTYNYKFKRTLMIICKRIHAGGTGTSKDTVTCIA